MTTSGTIARRIGAALVSLLFFGLLLSLAGLGSFPKAALGALVVFAGFAAWQPATALLILTTVLPVAAWLGRRVNGEIAWAEALVLAFTAGYCAREVVSPRSSRDNLGTPIVLCAAVVLASLVVQLLVDSWRFGTASVQATLSQLLAGEYLRITATGEPVDAAMRLLESLVLFRAVSSLVRGDLALAPMIVKSFVFGAAAAAAVNIARLWEGALRLSSPVAVFGRYFLTQRFNAHYGDLNAAGSYFVMALCPAAGMAWRYGRRWILAAVVIVAGLWITGSRAAFVAGLVAMMLPAAIVAGRISGVRMRRMAGVAAGVLLVVTAVFLVRLLPERGNQQAPSTALEVRWELARTSLRILSAEPLFGAGIGRYYSRSGEFSSPRLLELFPPAIHENAHNNFMQILAELGLVGFTAVGWLLLTAARSCARLIRAAPDDPLRWGIVVGLLAFAISWLGGHPLLIDEPAFAFWILLATACGWDVPSPPAPRRTMQWVIGGVIALIAVSIPMRATHDRADFNLEHRGIGVSNWQDDLDGVRYRRAGSTSSVFVPSGYSTCSIPLRAVRPWSEMRVQLWLDGRRADEVQVRSDRWLDLRLLLPQGQAGPRFHRLEFRVSDVPTDGTPVLMIGKVQVR